MGGSCDRSCDLHLGDCDGGLGRHLQVNDVPRPLAARHIHGNQKNVRVLEVEAGVRVRETGAQQLVNISEREKLRKIEKRSLAADGGY